jgi:thiol:disulfide interchange protein
MAARPLRRIAMAAGALWGLAVLLTSPATAGGGQGSAFDSGPVRSSEDAVRATVEPAATRVAPGADLPVAIVLDFRPSWHAWADDRALPESVARFDGAIHTAVHVDRGAIGAGPLRATAAPAPMRPGMPPPDGTAAALVQWPAYSTIEADVGDGRKPYAVFSDRAVIYMPLVVAADAPSGPATISGYVQLQACDDSTCVAPADIPFSVTVNVEQGATMGAPGPLFANFDPAIFAAIHSGAPGDTAVRFDIFGRTFDIDPTGAGFLVLLAIAAVGGSLLNFTPCVLPVIPLKILSISRAAGHPRRCLALGVALSAGVVLFWIALGAAMSLISGFTSANQLFQYPLFTIGVGVVIAVMALGMCGAFNIVLPQRVYMVETKQDTLPGAVGFGVMTAVLSTPCTAPLMGAAAAWAVTESPATVLSVFGSIGAGMALPYLILSAKPSLVERVPRSGPASDALKTTMGLLLLAAAAYFVGSGLSGAMVTAPDPPSTMYWWAVAACAIAAGGYMFARTMALAKSVRNRVVLGGASALIVAVSVGVGVRMTDKGPIPWTYYTPERFAEALARGDTVMLDFTAEWCLNCKTLEKTVLESSPVVARIAKGGVVPMKVDITGNNDPGRAKLKDAGRVTIPFLVVYSPNGTPTLESDLYTPAQVVEAIDRATATK